MKILWVNQFAALPEDGGGTRHFELGRELVRRGWPVSVMASDFHLHRRVYTRRPGTADRSPVPEVVDGVEFQWLWAAAYSGNDWRRLMNWWTFSRSALRAGRTGPRPDVVIGSSPQLLAARAARQVAQAWGCPFVFEVRDLWPESLVAAGGTQGMAYRVLDHIANDLYRTADLILVLTDGVADYLRKKGVKQPIACVPNGADVQQPRRSPRAADDQRPLTLVYAGALGAANGLENVLEAAATFGPGGGVRFVFVGDGPERGRLEADARRRGLSHVSFLGPLPKSQLSEIFADADAGLMVLRDSPLFSFAVSPNKLFDYLAAGLPVVNNVSGEVAQMLLEAGAGVQTEDGSAAGLVAAITRFQGTDTLTRLRMHTDGRRWVEQTHSRVVLSQRLIEALEALR